MVWVISGVRGRADASSAHSAFSRISFAGAPPEHNDYEPAPRISVDAADEVFLADGPPARRSGAQPPDVTTV